MKLVYIEWWDHVCFRDNLWKTEEEMKDIKPTLFRSVGYIVKEDERFLWMCSTISEEEPDFQCEGKHVHCLVKSCIKKRKNVKI